MAVAVVVISEARVVAGKAAGDLVVATVAVVVAVVS